MAVARILSFLLIAVVSSGCASLPFGSRTPIIDRIQTRGEIRIGMTGDYPPLNALDRSGRYIGLEPELAQALATTLRVELVVVNRPFAELIPALEAGEIDAVLSGMTMSPERNMRVAFAGPYFISGKAVLTRSEPLARARDARELDRPGLTLTVLEGTTSQDLVQNGMPRATLLTAKSYKEAVQHVIDGRADALIADYPVCVTTWLRNPEAGLETWIEPFTFEPIGIALPPDDPLFINLVENYLRSLEGTGLLETLRDKWFNDGSWLRRLP